MNVEETLAVIFDELRQLRMELSEQRKLLTGVAHPQREYWKPREVADRYAIKDVETVRSWCKQDKIKAEKDEYSGQWLIPNAEVERLDKTGGKPCVSQAA